MKSNCKRTNNCNRYQSKVRVQQQNTYSDYLTDTSFQGVNRLFVLLFENNADRTGHTGYFMSSVETEYYNVMIDDQNILDQPVKNNIRTYNNIPKNKAGEREDYTTDCLLFYPYFNEHYKMILIDLSKQQALDVDPKVIPKTNFTGNLERVGNTTMFFITEETTETILYCNFILL